MPTVEQAFECVRVCQALSNCYQSINLFRYDDTRKIIYIIAGANDGIEVEVYANGIWEFVNDKTEF